MLSTFVRRPLAVATIVGAVGAAHAATGVCGLKLRPSDAAPPAAPPALRLRPLRPEDHKRLRLAEFARRNYSLHGWLEQQISNRDVRSWMSARVFKLEGATLTCIDERGGSLRYPVEEIDTVEVLEEETFKITFKEGVQERELLLRPCRGADGVRAAGHHSALTWVTVLEDAKRRADLAEFARRNYSLHGRLGQQISNGPTWMSPRVFKLEGATLTCSDETGGSLRYPVEDIDTVEVLTKETFKITFKQGAQKRELLLRPVGRRADGRHSALTWVTVLEDAKRRADSSSRFADVFEALQAEKEVAEVWEDIAGSLGFSEKVTGRCSLEQLPVTVKTFMVALRKKVPQLDSILKRVTDRLNGDM